MKLSQCLQSYLPLPPSYDREISDLCIDSRAVKPGDVFIALTGEHHDGRQFIEQALAQGAIAVICEAEENAIFEREIDGNIMPIIHLCDLQLRPLAEKVYGYPGRELTMIGITGTNGKSTCSHLLAQALNYLGYKTAVIGTLGNGLPQQLQKSVFTTPEPVALQRTLRQFVEQGITHVAMEVSSHALALQRINTDDIDVAVFTNLTQDHLDFHGDMASYAQAKLRLFRAGKLQQVIINGDDEFSQTILNELSPTINPIIYGHVQKSWWQQHRQVQALSSHFDQHGLQSSLTTFEGQGQLTSSLLGQFNEMNCLAVVGALLSLNINLTEVLTALAKASAIPGRLQCFRAPSGVLLVVDYAHTPDALINVLATLQSLLTAEAKLWCIFGCGGDRDKAKRPLMAQAVEQYADKIVVTDDNPRYENGQQIIDDICRGFNNNTTVTVERDRQQAISYAYQHANDNDIVLIAGKGHEDYQLIADKRLAMSDIEWVEHIIA